MAGGAPAILARALPAATWSAEAPRCRRRGTAARRCRRAAGVVAAARGERAGEDESGTRASNTRFTAAATYRPPGRSGPAGSIETWLTRTRNSRAPTQFGPNAWLVDEMYEQYRADPSSVSESWQEFFADYRHGAVTTGARAGARRPRRRPPPAPPPRRRRGRRAARRRAAAPPRPSAGRADPRRRRPHRRQHGGQPRRPDGHQLPRGPGQAARGQPQGHQRLPRPHPRRQGQLHPPHRLRRRAGHRRRPCR